MGVDHRRPELMKVRPQRSYRARLDSMDLDWARAWMEPMLVDVLNCGASKERARVCVRMIGLACEGKKLHTHEFENSSVNLCVGLGIYAKNV